MALRRYFVTVVVAVAAGFLGGVLARKPARPPAQPGEYIKVNKADLGSLYSPSAEIKELRAEVIELSGGPGLSRILLDGRSDRPAIVFEDSLGKQRITLRLDQRSMSHFDLTDPLGNTRLGMVVFNYGPWDAGIYLEDWRGRQIWTRP